MTNDVLQLTRLVADMADDLEGLTERIEHLEARVERLEDTVAKLVTTVENNHTAVMSVLQQLLVQTAR